MNLSPKDFLKHNLNWDLSALQFIEKAGGLSSDNYKIIYNNKIYF